MQKQLEPDSKYNDLDADHDGVVSDAEMELAKLEHQLRKQRAQRRMATATLIGMAVYTAMLVVPGSPDGLIEQVIKISALFYLSGGGIMAAFFGTTAWVERK